jgi:hypothetical protein
VFTARYALSPYVKQICFVFKGLNKLRSLYEKVSFKSKLNVSAQKGHYQLLYKNQNEVKKYRLFLTEYCYTINIVVFDGNQ